MLLRKTLEIDIDFYEKTKNVLINNGSKVSEHTLGSRKTLFSDHEICGFYSSDNSLPLSQNLDSKKFFAFLGIFNKCLYSQIKNNDSLLSLNIDFHGCARAKNKASWLSLKNKEIFYNLDLSSAYWQMAYKLGYINEKLFLQYIENDDYKQAKRYCVSFLARENHMRYFDGRPINEITCDTSCLNTVYMNIRHELYNTIDNIKNQVENWIEYNIDGISVMSKDLDFTKEILDQFGLRYKVNECFKIDKHEYYFKGKIRKF
jgi:hypothetical protein